jgi:hypothetical protein
MEQMLELMKPMQEEMRANQVKKTVHRKADREHMQQMMTKIETDRQEMMVRMDANQERMNASLREEMQSAQAEMRSAVNAWITDMKKDRKETMFCKVTTEACLGSKELNQEDMESEGEHGDVPTEEATVKSSGTMKKLHRGWHIAAG